MRALLAYDPARVRVLALRTAAVVRWLDARDSTDPMAENAIATARTISHAVCATWMPWFSAVLGDRSMCEWDECGPNVAAPTCDGVAATARRLSADEVGEVAHEMVDLVDDVEGGDSGALVALGELMVEHGDDPAVMAEFARRMGPGRVEAFIAFLASGAVFPLGAALTVPRRVDARDRVLAALLPTPLGLETNPDFDLSDAVSAGGDWLDAGSAWWDAINPACRSFPGGMYTGGGFVTGPDGREYPVVIPNVSANGGTYTADIGTPDPGQPCVANLDGSDDGWTPIAYQSGVERFQESPSWAERTLGFFAGMTGLVVTPPPSGGLQFIQMLPGALPYLAAAPAGAPRPLASAEPESADTVERAATAQAAIDVAVRGSDGWVFATNMDNQRERAYQVIYEENEQDGRIRARIETFTLAQDADGDTVIVPEDVWVSSDGQLMSQLTTYAPPDGATGVWSDVSNVAFEPGTTPAAYEVPGQSFP